jgi:hypothetical protein
MRTYKHDEANKIARYCGLILTKPGMCVDRLLYTHQMQQKYIKKGSELFHAHI